MRSRTGAAGGETTPVTERTVDDVETTELVAVEDDAVTWTPKTRNPPTRQGSTTSGSTPRSVPWVARSRGRSVLAAAAAALALVAIYVLCSVGPVNTVLRQSFSQISSPSVQFYLNGDPWVSGEILNVYLGILQDTSGAASYKVHLWTVDGTGKTDSSRTVAVPVQNGAGKLNVSLPIPVGGQVLWAQVVGTSLSVHYRFAGSAIATASSSS